MPHPYSQAIVFFLERLPNKLGVKYSVLKAAISHLSPSSLHVSSVPCLGASWLGFHAHILIQQINYY